MQQQLTLHQSGPSGSEIVFLFARQLSLAAQPPKSLQRRRRYNVDVLSVSGPPVVAQSGAKRVRVTRERAAIEYSRRATRFLVQLVASYRLLHLLLLFVSPKVNWFLSPPGWLAPLQLESTEQRARGGASFRRAERNCPRGRPCRVSARNCFTAQNRQTLSFARAHKHTHAHTDNQERKQTHEHIARTLFSALSLSALELLVVVDGRCRLFVPAGSLAARSLLF